MAFISIFHLCECRASNAKTTTALGAYWGDRRCTFKNTSGICMIFAPQTNHCVFKQQHTCRNSKDMMKQLQATLCWERISFDTQISEVIINHVPLLLASTPLLNFNRCACYSAFVRGSSQLLANVLFFAFTVVLF